METYTAEQLTAAFDGWLAAARENRADDWDAFRAEVEGILDCGGYEVAYEVLEFLPPLGEFGTDNDPLDNPEWLGRIVSQVAEYVGDAWPEVA